MHYLVMTTALLVALSAGLSPDIVTAQTSSAGGQDARTTADRVDLNSADQEALEALPGVGPPHRGTHHRLPRGAWRIQEGRGAHEHSRDWRADLSEASGAGADFGTGPREAGVVMPWRVGAPGWFSCSPGPRPEETPNDSLGVTLLELLVATLLGTTLLAMATPAFQRLATAQQERLAVRYVVAEVMLARAQAARRGTSVGIRFGRDMRGYYFGTYVDGNGNGLRATDVRRGVDQPIGPTPSPRGNVPGSPVRSRPLDSPGRWHLRR